MKKRFSDYLKKYQLENRNPYAVIINDKINVKRYVDERLGENDLFNHRLYAGYNTKKTIESTEAPCVIRLSNGWHKMKFIMTCDDTITERELREWIKIKFADYWWTYQQIIPGFTVERVLAIRHNLLKFFVFNGRVEYVWQQQYTVEGGAIGKLLFATMYDRNWKKINVQWNKNAYPNCDKPKRLNEMIYICEKLAWYEHNKTWPFLRIDLYYNHDKIRLSEMQDSHAGGTNGFSGDFDFVLYEKLGIIDYG